MVRSRLIWHGRWDIDFDFQWLPRSHPVMQLADYMSKQEDTAAFIITRATLRHIRQRIVAGKTVTWGSPTLDVFGGGAQDEHAAPLYYTEICQPGSAGTNAFMHPWTRSDKAYQLAWVFPPFGQVAQALRYLAGQQPCHAILILPEGQRAWSPLLQQLPIVDDMRLGHKNVYRMGIRAPAGWKQPAQMPQRSLHAYRVWPAAS